ncbi:MAG: hypothetical protein LQ347_004380 [Umbilicaria vellea]|nr:MAG: hypothetical protein LQ347_004380 [Umbilicaria vellea]
MSAPEENWGGHDSPTSGPSHTAKAAEIGEEGALLFGFEEFEEARAEEDTATVGTPSSEASTVKLDQGGGVAREPRIITLTSESTDWTASTMEPQYPDNSSSSFLIRHDDPEVTTPRDVNPDINSQDRYRGDRPKPTAESDIPPRFELFLLGDGEKKVTEAPDTRIPSSSIFTFNKEDHTLGNLLRSRLLQSSHVAFAGYRVPHPLFSSFELRIQTDGTLTPRAALVQACRDLVNDFGVLGREFTKEWELRKMVGEGGSGAGGE